MSKKAFIIVVDRATGDQLNEVHRLVKENSNGWWHHFTNFWIVFGKTPWEWRDIVKQGLRGGNAGVLVIRMAPPGHGPRWSGMIPNGEGKYKWLHEQLPKDDEND